MESKALAGILNVLGGILGMKFVRGRANNLHGKTLRM